MTLYTKRKLHLAGLAAWEMRLTRCRRVCKSQNVCPLVIPHIDYCSQLWMSVEGAGICSLEKHQHDFFRNIPELRAMNYWECLKHMNMISMQRRLQRCRVIKTLKILEKTCSKLWYQASSRIRGVKAWKEARHWFTKRKCPDQ